jgi:hypothetical protein
MGNGRYDAEFRSALRSICSIDQQYYESKMRVTSDVAWIGWRFRSEGPAEWTETDNEFTVLRYVQDYVSCGKPPGLSYIVRRPIKGLEALVALFRLPGIRVAISSFETEAASITALLSRHHLLARVGGFAAAVLKLPDEAGQYSLGASKQTLRRKVRYAERLGVRWAEVNDMRERSRLLRLAGEFERVHPNIAYRNPNPDNSDLLKYRLWLAAYSADGRPLLLSVSPLDGDVASLTYFRTLGVGQEQTNARYLMMQVLVESLVSRGVRYLVDSGSLAMPNGLRHFQRMLGFRIVRIRIARPSRS